MSFTDAVRSCFSQYAGFSGRARRSEYWFWSLFAFIVYVVATVIGRAVGFPALAVIASLALLLPGLAVSVRRLHDTSRSGLWVLIALVPIVGAIVLIVFTVQDSTPTPNAWGPSPKQVPGSPATDAAPVTGY